MRRFCKAEGRAVGRYLLVQPAMRIEFCIAVLEIALSRELVARNVASVIAPPKVADVEVKALKADQVALVLAALRGHWLEPIVVLALTSGARRGEILALTWGSVDLQRGS